ncbi:MAG TPA: hypothetical protein VFZ91_02850 [Allosphingosinicella sp.]
MAAPRRNPPRWFAPSIFAGLFLAVAALAGLGALLYEPDDEAVGIGDRTYVIPPADISSFTRDPHLFLRIKRADQPFEIVHDARGAGQRDRTGVPHIFSVNDQGHHDVWYARDERSTVVCRRAGSPVGGCGTWISYGGATWSILFPESRIGDADGFARQGTALLRKYDTRSSRIVP